MSTPKIYVNSGGPVDLQTFFNPEFAGTSLSRQVDSIAREMLWMVNQPDVLARISEANQPGHSSAMVQKSIAPVMLGLGFHEEKFGLFKATKNQRRPDFHLPLGERDGILLEVERGKTTTNNMDFLDFWKCHVCDRANYLFLFAPRFLQHKQGDPPTNEFNGVASHLKWFFEPGMTTNVRGLHLFGY